MTSPSGEIAVLRGKTIAGGARLYVGAVMVLASIANAIRPTGEASGLGTAAFCLLVGGTLVAFSARLTLQTVRVFPDRLVWRRFPNEVVIPFAAIARVENVARTTQLESFDEVRLTLADGSVHVVDHLADGNDLVRVINTYGVRRV